MEAVSAVFASSASPPLVEQTELISTIETAISFFTRVLRCPLVTAGPASFNAAETFR